MKFKKSTFLVLVFVSSFFGCNAINRLATRQETVTPPQIIGTNIVAVSASTNAAGVVTPAHVESVPVYSAPVTNTVFVASPTAQNILTTGSTVSSVIPPPYGAIGTMIFAGLSGLLGIWLKTKNNKLIEAQDVASLVNPIIAGVESGNDPGTKAAIQAHAAAAGVQPALDAKVQAMSNQMPDIKVTVPTVPKVAVT